MRLSALFLSAVLSVAAFANDGWDTPAYSDDWGTPSSTTRQSSGTVTETVTTYQSTVVETPAPQVQQPVVEYAPQPEPETFAEPEPQQVQETVAEPVEQPIFVEEPAPQPVFQPEPEAVAEPAPQPAPNYNQLLEEPQPEQQAAKTDNWQEHELVQTPPAEQSGSGLHVNWKIMGISAGVCVLGGGLGYLFNKMAKDATSDRPEKGSTPKPEDYQDNYDKAGTYQTLRAVSIGLIGLGAVGIGLSFVF